MTAKEINTAIFESLGWKYVPPTPKRHSYVIELENLPRWTKGRGKRYAYSDDIPDYCNDLNAMREAVLTKKAFPGAAYVDHLADVLDSSASYHLIEASAAQRAEAFLKTLNLWEP